MNILQAWDVLNKHTYFVRPYYNNEGNITSFDSGFDMNNIFPIQTKKGKIKWICEHGSFCLESGVFWLDEKNTISAKTFEKVIIKMAKWLIKNFGEDDYMDYFVCSYNFENMFEKKGEYYIFRGDKDKPYWKTEELIEKIKSYEKRGD